jgi:chemotaxis methyl-accepting protein methylase
MNARSPSDEARHRARFEPSAAALDALLQRLVASSSFPPALLSRARLASHLMSRAQELRLPSTEALVVRIADDATEYARVEGLFSPPETWLFRYPESYAFLRARVASSETGVFRVLIAGCGGWCEPISVACALMAGTAGLDGAAEARRIEIDAVDRNPHVLNGEPRFAGLEVRSGVPEWAERWFDRDDTGLIPKREVCAVIRPRVIDVVAMVEECVARRARYDAILFRNVAIYLDDQTRARIFRGFAEILAEDGVLLVGHSETFAAAEATGFAPLSAAGAFALSAKRTEGTATERAAHDPSNVQSRMAKSPTRALSRPADATAHERAREPVRKPEPVDEELTPASYISRARELEASGDLLSAWQVIGKALYIDRSHEEALVLAAQLAEKRGDGAEAERLRMRALRVHLANESMRDRRA